MDEQFIEGAAIAMIVLNSLSFLSLGFVLVVYACSWKKIASFPMRLTFYLCISCMLQNLNVLVINPFFVNAQTNSTSTLCAIGAVEKTTADLSSIIWTTLIIYSTYSQVVQGHTVESREIVYLVMGFGVPLVLSVGPVIFGIYGPNVYSCWFADSDLDIEFGLKLGYFFVPLWVSFVLDIFWAVSTYRKLKEVGLEGRELQLFKRITLFPLILLITGLFATADLIYNYLSHHRYVLWFDVISIFLLNCYGLANSIAYGFNPHLRQHILLLLGVRSRSPSFTQTSTDQSRRTQRLSELTAL